MGSLDKVKRDNFTMRGYLADSRKEDPRRCWPFQSLIDYHEFRRISESTPAASNVQINQKGRVVVSKNPAVSEIRRNQKGVVVGSENPAASGVHIKKNKRRKEVASDNPSDSDDDIPIGELLRRRKALKVQAPSLAPEKSCPASSSDGLELLSTVALMWGSGSRVNGARVHAPEKPRPDGSSGGLQPPALMPSMREPVTVIGGARVQAPEMAPAEQPEREVIVCRVSRNPAEFSPEEAKLFLRRL